VKVFHQRMQSAKSHGLGEIENGLTRVHQTAVPVHFQDTPNPLDRVVFTVIRGVVSQVKCELKMIHQFGDALHELGTAAVIFWSVIEVQNQTGHLWKTWQEGCPAILKTIDDEITRHLGVGKIQIDLAILGEQDAKRCELGIRLKIMIGGFHNDATASTPRIVANPNAGFGIQGESQHGFIGICLSINTRQLLENCIRLRYLFWGRLFCTARSL